MTSKPRLDIFINLAALRKLDNMHLVSVQIINFYLFLINCRETASARLKINSAKWTEYARTAFAVDPRIAFALGARFPTNS
ncbi:hypothetical protein OSB04_032177 [Centaurea solstitialis]|uniref:Uncharacterized protein n=1 Tax=Centaurea solstitialis TaxID=347529 RepID=A0AA38SAJ1_9ASTR|nr:hypothetical protein OSB04_032177 [Centaurea solstitialis]